MSVVAGLARRTIRQEMIPLCQPEDTYLLDQPSAIVGSPAGGLTWATLAGAFSNDHFRGAEVRCLDNGTVATRRVTAWAGATGTATLSSVLASTLLAQLTNVELIAAPYRFAQYDAAIQAVLRDYPKQFETDADDTTLCTQYERREYPVPAGIDKIRGVQVLRHSFSRDRFVVPPSSLTATEYPLASTAANVRRAQRVIFLTSQSLAIMFLEMRRIGAPAGTMTLQLQTESAGFPSGTALGASATFLESAVPTRPTLIGFVFPADLLPAVNTNYWLTLTTSRGADAVNYIALRADSAGVYAGGPTAVYGGSWSAVSGALGFRLVDGLRAEWADLRPAIDYTVPNGTTRTLRLIKNEILAGNIPIRLLTRRAPTQLTSDGATVDVDPGWLRWQASAYYVLARARGDGKLLQQAAVYTQAAEKRRAGSRPRPSAGVVEGM